MLRKELGSNLREQGVGEDILRSRIQEALLFELFLIVGESRTLRIVLGDIIDDFLRLEADGLREKVAVDGDRSLAEQAAGQILELLRNHGVALAGDNVHRGHRADNLRRRRDERRIAEVFADARHLVEQVLIFVLGTHALELVREIREHAARNLEIKDVRIEVEVALEVEGLDEVLLHGGEMLRYRGELLDIDAGIIRRTLEHADHGLGAGLGRVGCEWREGAVDDIDAGLYGLQIGSMTEAGRAVRVELDRDIEGGLEFLDQVLSYIRLEQAGHIFYADGVAAHFLELLGEVDEHLVRMYRADGIDEAALDFRFLRAVLGCVYSDLEVADIIESIEDTENADTMLRCSLDEFLDDIVGVMVVPQKVLPAQQHLYRGVEF